MCKLASQLDISDISASGFERTWPRVSIFTSLSENFTPPSPPITSAYPLLPPQAHASAPAKVLEAVLSHQGLAHKCDLLSRLMAALVLPAPAHYRSHLRRLAALAGGVKGAGELAARAAALLVS